MRIIAGRLKNMPLDAPKSGTRPTTDRTKEAVFSHLKSIGALDGGAVLDLFAGSGALGLEALSRGADQAVFVDASAGAVACLRRSLATARKNRSWNEDGLSARIVRGTAQSYIAKLTKAHSGEAKNAEQKADEGSGALAAAGPRFSVVFLDPPYAFSDADFNGLLAAVASSGALEDSCVMVVERSSRSAQPAPPAGWETEMTRSYGETVISYLSAAE